MIEVVVQIVIFEVLDKEVNNHNLLHLVLLLEQEVDELVMYEMVDLELQGLLLLKNINNKLNLNNFKFYAKL
jgi:hypothetical protein